MRCRYFYLVRSTAYFFNELYPIEKLPDFAVYEMHLFSKYFRLCLRVLLIHSINGLLHLFFEKGIQE